MLSCQSHLFSAPPPPSAFLVGTKGFLYPRLDNIMYLGKDKVKFLVLLPLPSLEDYKCMPVCVAKPLAFKNSKYMK